MSLGKNILIHLLVWFIACTIVFILVPKEYFSFAVIGAFVVLAIDYIAMRVVWLKYSLFAIIGVTLAIVISGYV